MLATYVYQANRVVPTPKNSICTLGYRPVHARGRKILSDNLLNSRKMEFDTDTAGFGGEMAGDIYNFNVEPIGGGTYSYVNFRMDKYSSSNNL
ncbi:hypothetical protein [Bacillus sp. S14(2024)]|uniref:hypothetical protein n=1 Tax=Bacillus sp. S14(2024) TaxID=3162884 RepID=UPI003D1F93E2